MCLSRKLKWVLGGFSQILVLTKNEAPINTWLTRFVSRDNYTLGPEMTTRIIKIDYGSFSIEQG